MPITKLRPTPTFDQERLDALAAVAPEACAESVIIPAALRMAPISHLRAITELSHVEGNRP